MAAENKVEDSCDRKVVLVTGCTKGIGKALFEWFVASGHLVAGCGTSTAELDRLKRANPHALLTCVDLREEAAVQRWISEVSSKFGLIDLLICNAGVLPAHGDVWAVPAEEWESALAVNVQGTARALRHAVPQLRSPGATVVLMSSRYGRSVVKGQGCYAASKWAVEGMAKTLALEMKDRGVTAVSLDPGVVCTDMLRKSAGPGGEAWCSEQRSPADFAADVGPFLLSLSLDDTGRNLTALGSPSNYFETGVVYKDRPAWANGFGGFIRACDEASHSNDGEGKRKRARLSTPLPAHGPSRRYFISGVMLGSNSKLQDASRDLVPQDYRQQIACAIKKADSRAVIFEPLDDVKAFAAARGKTIEELHQDDALVREAFCSVVERVKDCDVIISNLPEASMGSAVELWEAKKAGLLIYTISPLAENWTIRSVTDHNFKDLEDLEANLESILKQN